MPKRINTEDWDILFAPNAPRRGGPLQALGNVMLFVVVIGIFVGVAFFVNQYNVQQRTSSIATATAFAATVGPLQTMTAAAQTGATATREAARTATALAGQPTPEPVFATGVVLNGGNMRSEPRIASETVLGLVWPGDTVAFLEEQTIGGQTWYRIRVTAVAPNRGGQGIDVGGSGWVSASLLSAPTPVPAATP